MSIGLLAKRDFRRVQLRHRWYSKNDYCLEQFLNEGCLAKLITLITPPPSRPFSINDTEWHLSLEQIVATVLANATLAHVFERSYPLKEQRQRREDDGMA